MQDGSIKLQPDPASIKIKISFVINQNKKTLKSTVTFSTLKKQLKSIAHS